MEKYYRFAGLEFLAVFPGDGTCREDRVLAPFAVDSVTDPHRFFMELVDALPAPQGRLITRQPDFVLYEQDAAEVRYVGTAGGDWCSAQMRTERRGKDHFVQLRAGIFPNGPTDKTLLNAMAAEHLLARNRGFIFHSSYIRREDKAILFTAPSGTGKSTQADLWAALRGAEIINGDRSAVCVAGSGVMAHGVPFSGSSQFCKFAELPLAAVVYLSQAPETSIRRLRGYEAFFRIWEGCSVNTWDAEDMRQVSDTVTAVAEAVPVYHLACTPDESAVLALEAVLH